MGVVLAMSSKKKNRKKRGQVSSGCGRIGKHRKHSGGCGNAGGQHHHRINFDKYHPGYFGKVGMRYFHKLRAKLYHTIINLDQIWNLVTNFSLENSKKNLTKTVLIDITK